MDKQLKLDIQKACHEIRALRHRNEILSAKVEMIDLFACVLHTQPAINRECVSSDIVWTLEKALEAIPIVTKPMSKA